MFRHFLLLKTENPVIQKNEHNEGENASIDIKIFKFNQMLSNQCGFIFLGEILVNRID
jgi:hypothetical protein